MLEAARTLSAQLLQEAKTDKQQALVGQNLMQAKAALEEAEFELAFADMQFGAARYHAMSCDRARKGAKLNAVPCAEMTALIAARKHLWTVGIDGNDEAILEAARSYGEKTTAFWLLHEERNKLEADWAAAVEAQRIAGEARKEAVQKRGRARWALQQAEAEQCSFYKQLKFVPNEFAAQDALHQAAALLTGTQDQGFAFSYLKVQDLDVGVV